jgi:hypothetical protein
MSVLVLVDAKGRDEEFHTEFQSHRRRTPYLGSCVIGTVEMMRIHRKLEDDIVYNISRRAQKNTHKHKNNIA